MSSALSARAFPGLSPGVMRRVDWRDAAHAYPELAMLIGIVLWIVIGALASLLVSRFVKLHGDDPRLSMGVSAVAGFLTALLYTMFAGVAITMWMPKAFMWAAIGGGAAAGVWYALRAMLVTRAPYKPRQSY